nr:phage N-6-adenine-methyltransferase [uncultured Haemophilus sp.]
MTTHKTTTAKEDKDKWATPFWAFRFARKWFGFPQFDIDCAASAHNTKCEKFISEEENAIVGDWDGNYCWLNPPYSNPLPFVEKAIEQSRKGRKVVMLLNVDNSTQWFAQCVKYATAIVMITEGRIPFIHNATGLEVKGNSKPQMFVLFDYEKWQKRDQRVRTYYRSIQQVKEMGKKNL